MAGPHSSGQFGLRETGAEASPEQLGGDLELWGKRVVFRLDLRIGKETSFELFERDCHLTSLLAEQGVDALLLVGVGGEEAGARYQEFHDLLRAGTVVQISLVERSGEVLWFQLFTSSHDYELRNRKVADELFRILFDEFPRGRS